VHWLAGCWAVRVEGVPEVNTAGMVVIQLLVIHLGAVIGNRTHEYLTFISAD